VLLFKIFLAPVLIALISLAGRKWGPGVSGWLLGIPFNSGPILFFLSLEQGAQFASHTALGSLLGILAWVAFTLVYSYCCLRMRWWSSTIIGWIAYFAVAALLLPAKLGLVWSFLVVTVSLALVLWVFPRVQSVSAAGYGKYDLVLRMVTACGMVLSLTSFARWLGPMASGLLSAFPAYTTILAVFTHRQSAAAAVTVLKGVTAGLYTAAVFFLILSPALLHLHIAAAFGLAIAGGLVVQAASLFYVRRNA